MHNMVPHNRGQVLEVLSVVYKVLCETHLRDQNSISHTYIRIVCLLCVCDTVLNKSVESVESISGVQQEHRHEY